MKLFQKYPWSQGLVLLYVVFSAAYILLQLWGNMMDSYAVSAFEDGVAFSLNQVIQQAQLEACESFTVFNESTQVELVNVDCLSLPSE